MPIFRQKQRMDLDQLVEEYSKQPLPRREFLQRAMKAGLSVSAASALLAACGGSPATGPTTSNSTPKSIDVLSVWGGEELDTFKAVCAPFTQKTKIAVNNESTRDINAVLQTRVRGNNPPDIVALPNIPQMQMYAKQNKLVRLDKFMDQTTLSQQYAKSWLDLASYNGGLYAVWLKGTNKGTVWYSPKQFKALNIQPPKTWDEMIALSNKLAASGKYPWSMGVESGAASGWPAADWVAQIFLNQSGPDLYDQWVAHKIPWTHDSVKNAFQTFGQITGGKHYIDGAPQSILATGDEAASYEPFQNPPQAYMYYLGDFTIGFLTSQFKNIKASTDFDYFPFPTINSQYQGAITVAGDIMAAMRDNDGTRQFMTYLTTPEAQSIWVQRGGATSVNKKVDLSLYPSDVARNSAKMLTDAPINRFGAGDLMPAAVQTAFWKGLLTFIGDQKQLNSVLSTIEDAAQQGYTS
ncbi:MAG TPA: ABC transporter substrate-binding protein [Ktedonobacteraceae bacterium]|jgi:alpha-glucoside transport system substrate-binding protein|nr:ABC transporter substrate-binding protein [Ktedonobacteraceae bacterium]